MIRKTFSLMSKAMSFALMLLTICTPFSFSETNGYVKEEGVDWGLVMITILAMTATWLVAMIFSHLSQDLKNKR